MKPWIKRSLLLVWIGTLSACAISPKADTDVAATTTPTLPPEYAAALELLEREQWNAAEAALLAYAAKHPRQSSPQVNLAHLYKRSGRDEQAKAALQKALQINPKQAAAHNLQGIYARDAGDFAAAKKAYQTAIAANPRYPYAHLNLAILWDLYLHNPSAALPHYEQYATLIGAEALDQEVKSWIADAQRQAQGGG